MGAGGARIALFLPRLSRYGGVEGVAWRLAEGLARQGHAVDWVCARVEAEAPAGVRPVPVGRVGLVRAGKILWFALQAERIRREGGYDLTIGLGKTLSQDLLRLSAGPLDIFWELSARAYGPGLPRAAKTLSRRLSATGLAIRWIEARQLMRSGRLAAVSAKVGEWLKARYPAIAGKDIAIIHNRPDLSRFRPASTPEREAARLALGLKPGQTAVGVAGTNFMLKGVGTLVKAMALLPRDHVAVVAGGRDPRGFERLAQGLGVGDRVRFLGRVEDMPGFYRALDVFALPTFYDTCSNAVLEALASGVRVITSADDGSSVFLPESRILPDPADHATLASLIGQAMAEDLPGRFAWPAGVKAGLDPYLSMVAEMLGRS